MIKVKSSGQRIFFPVLTSQVEQLVLVAFCDASHKSMPDRLRSVEGVTVFLVSKVDNKAAVLQWVSRIVQRSKGVQTSPSAAEAIALNLGLALLKELKVVMEDILQQEIETVLVTDSKNVYQQVNSSVKITDPQASLDIANIRDPLETGAINHVTWVKSELMLADTLTKSKANSSVLSRVLADGKWRTRVDWPLLWLKTVDEPEDIRGLLLWFLHQDPEQNLGSQSGEAAGDPQCLGPFMASS